jgi:hypothetical protein
MNEKFPDEGEPGDADVIAFDRATLDNAWRRIKNAVDTTRKVKIWTNQPFDKVDDPIWNGHILMKEVDYVLNESPDTSLLEWMRATVGKQTLVVQDICGWANHNAEMWKEIDPAKYGFFGFAAADPETCMPTEKINPVSFRNLEIVREAYRKL